MLKKIERMDVDESCAAVRIADAKFPAPFRSGLEYSAPARGTWNIVHTGMLVPEGHEIFVCAASCLRGVVLTAAEQGTSDRFSTIAVRENNLLDGDMEQLIIDGVGDILSKLPKRPPAVLLYTSCVHHFTGCDLKLVYRRLREKYPDVDFTDCYMNPIMRKSGLTPDQLMRRQLYSLLKIQPLDQKSVNIIGNDFATLPTSELVTIVKEGGYTLREIQDCHSYAEYQQMATASLNIVYNPAAKAGAAALERRLGQKYLYLPLSYDYNEIVDGLNTLCDALHLPRKDFSRRIADCEAAMEKAKAVIGDTPIAIDYTLCYRPLSLARLLLRKGFNVQRVYLDGIGEEKADFEALQREAPDLMLYATVEVKMRFLHGEDAGAGGEHFLALGQKAAYFTGSDNFVNIVECGGLYGFDGIIRLAGEMEDAYLHKKDARRLIQIKGFGGGCCL